MAYKFVSVAEMQAIEKEANANGLSYEQMMENAGSALAEVIVETYGYLESGGICGLVGSGNNGGDTLVALTHLAELGWSVYAYIIRPRPVDDLLLQQLQNAGGIIYWVDSDPGFTQLHSLLADNAIVLDGVLGTGFRLPLKREVAEVLEFVKKVMEESSDPPIIVAVDCPSGIDCDSGEVAAETIPADHSVTMAAIKRGLFQFPANKYLGELSIVGIGLPVGSDELPTYKSIKSFVPDSEWVRTVMPRRTADAHKGTFGTAMVVAGSINFTGAAWLAGQAAYRIGAGLVTMAVPESLHPILAGQFPEATWLILPEMEGAIDRNAAEVIKENISKVTAMVLGPGFGMRDDTAIFLERLFTDHPNRQLGFVPSNNSDRLINPELPPLVIDADGLKLLTRMEEWWNKIPAGCILTPHPGEMSVLTGVDKEQIQANRLEITRNYSLKWKQIVVLKGAFTIIAEPSGKAAVIPIATPALARAGTGDVLAGIIVGLRAQGIDAFTAAVAGAWIHAQAGWHAAEELGNSASVLAGDVLRGIISVISEDLV